MARMRAVLAILAVVPLLIRPAVIAEESCGEDGGESHLTQTCQRQDGDRGGVTDEANRAPAGVVELGGQEYKSVKHFDESRKRRRRKGSEGEEALTVKGYGDRRHRKKKKEGDITRENKDEGNKLKGRYSDLHKDKQEGDGFSGAEISNKKVKRGKNGERKNKEKHKKNTMNGESRHTGKHRDGEKNKEYKSNRDQTKKNDHKHKHKTNTKDKKNEDKKYKNMKSKENKKNAGKKKYKKDKLKTAEDLNREEETNTEDKDIENIKKKIRVNRKVKDKIEKKVREGNVSATPETLTENEISNTEGETERARRKPQTNVATGNPDIDAEKQVTGKAKVEDERKTRNATINSEEKIGSDAIYDESLDGEGKVPENVVDVEGHAGHLKNVVGGIDEVTDGERGNDVAADDFVVANSHVNYVDSLYVELELDSSELLAEELKNVVGDINELTDGESSNDVVEDFVVANSHVNYVDSLFVELELDSSELLAEELNFGTVEENKKEQEMTSPEVAELKSEMSENEGNDDQQTEGEEVDRKDGVKKVYEVPRISETEVESDAGGPKTADGKAGDDDDDLLMSPELGSQSDQETVAVDVTAKDNHQEDVVVELGDNKGSE
ncbi:glutamic acid-rich protein [Procambarus clarkii]|uniref:glutamic acid-rich protein n=1 Tax=Procambarus clarkii TaxID=6728 RepID=UPI001E675500|nr:myb-like protein X [Procambarus clarkii]